MTTFFIYILEVTVCSALFSGYYWLVLRNSNFYHWNRFFINASVVLSIVIPLLNISIPVSPIALQDTYDNVIKYIAISDTVVTTAPEQSDISTISWLTLGFITYLIVIFVFLMKEFASFARIVRLKYRAEQIYANEVLLYCIDDNTAPFTFFRKIFWKKGISMDSGEGTYMLRHELAHVRLGHSWDKALMQLVCCIFWMNPFFILLRRELELVHEFEADRESLGEGNVEELSSLILSTVYPNHYHDFTSRFFQSSIKRRISMITKSKKSKLSIIRKIGVIPILIITLFAFSINIEKSVASQNSGAKIDGITQNVNTLSSKNEPEDQIITYVMDKKLPEPVEVKNPIKRESPPEDVISSDSFIEDVTQDVSSKKYEIQDIKVTGAPNYDNFVLIGFSGLRVGSEINIPGEEITEAVNRFWKQGLFSDVKIVATRIIDEKAWLEIQLKPRPRIVEINYNGINKNERKDFEEMINLRKGHMITPFIVERVKNIVKDYFDDKGYNNVDVNIVEKPVPAKEGEVTVDISIDKDGKTKI